MGINPLALLRFRKAHPKFVAFLHAADNEIYLAEGTVVEISLRNTAGQQIHANLRLTCEDLELLQALRKDKKI